MVLSNPRGRVAGLVKSGGQGPPTPPPPAGDDNPYPRTGPQPPNSTDTTNRQRSGVCYVPSAGCPVYWRRVADHYI